MNNADDVDLTNPAGTAGFEFLEFAAEAIEPLEALLERLGFTKIMVHRTRRVSLYRQGSINFLVNGEPGSFAQQFAGVHGPSACGMAFRVSDARHALNRALAEGAEEAGWRGGPFPRSVPAIKGIGGSLIYLVGSDQWDDLYSEEFSPVYGVHPNAALGHLNEIDHLTHNVRQGRMSYFADFYGRIFNFREIRYFDIKGEYTGLTSRALTAPCGKIRIPINESRGGTQLDQIEEFIQEYNGEGIQHIALSTDDILAAYDALAARGVEFMSPPPDTYYDALDERLPGHGEPIEELKRRGILLDGNGEGRLLLQIFTKPCIGPIFFEIIQRKGDEGFGEGNFKALFESIERDQVLRGVVRPDADVPA